MKFNIGDIVIINAPISMYNGLIGEIIDYDKDLNIYIVDTKIVRIGMSERELKFNN